MLTWRDDVEMHALRERGWSISAIARHLDRDRKTVRAYLSGDREPGRPKTGARGFGWSHRLWGWWELNPHRERF